jgi:hypothetical protein
LPRFLPSFWVLLCRRMPHRVTTGTVRIIIATAKPQRNQKKNGPQLV